MVQVLQLQPNSKHNIPHSEILHRFRFFYVLKDGTLKFKLPPTQTIPPCDDPSTGVKIKDVEISSDVSVRMFLPPSATSTFTAKLPVLVYIHGGGFCTQSAFSAEYTSELASIVAAGNIIAVSVEYGLFPSRPIPACYDDSWAALQWVAAHAGGTGPDPWLNHHADFNRIFAGGDSAGGNISHNLAVRAGSIGLPNEVKLAGIILIHPVFWDNDRMWLYMCPSNEGPLDSRIWPSVEDLEKLGCERVQVFLGEKDVLRSGGKRYADELMKSGWKGKVEVVENKDRDHCFHLINPKDEEAVANQKRIISFINHTHEHDVI